MLSVADEGECGREEDRWKLWSRHSGLLIGKLFIRRATAWPLPCHGRQSESSHLGSGAVLGLPGLPLLLCVVK